MHNNQNPYAQFIDLAQPRLGAEVVYASDEFFAAKERLIDPKPPVFIADKFDDNGKWMDGWESRRKRIPGHDDCIIKLGVTGEIVGIDIDTTHFTGNFPPNASIEACIHDERIPQNPQWIEIHPATELKGNSHHYLSIENKCHFTHLRLNIYPDGGIARCRVYGEVRPNWDKIQSSDLIDLLAVENGGCALACNDEHFGSMHNLNAPGRGINMGDGWETARRRTPGNDWVILALGHPGEIETIEIDTAHFKGNYPDRASIQAVFSDNGTPDLSPEQTVLWKTLLDEVKLEMDNQHYFNQINPNIGPITHIRLNIFPDGGVSRIRLLGHIAKKTALS